MRGQTFLATIIFSLILLSALSSAKTDISLVATKNQFKIGEDGFFKVTLTNQESTSQKYTIYSFQSGQGWNVDPSPLKDKIVEIGPGGSYTVTIKIQALDSFSPGIYTLPLTIESDQGERYAESLKIYLSPENPIDYIPSIKVTPDVDEKIDPSQPVSIKLFLENRNPLNLEDLIVKIESDMPEFVKEATVHIPPLEKKTVEFTITPNPHQQPKSYTLFFVFERRGQTVKVVEQKVEIITRLSPFEVIPREQKLFLKKITALTVTNPGNVLNTQQVKFPTTFWASMFTQGESDTINIDGQRYLAWELALRPNESSEILFVVNYRLLAYLLAAGLAFALFYWIVRSPVVLIKKASTKKGAEAGALSEIKITLEVQNRSEKPLQNVQVSDIVPTIVNVEKSLDVGTLKPKEIKHTKTGTVVTWSIAELDAQEHRLITYHVRAKLNILGTFSLPRATAEFTAKSGRKGKGYSNVFRLTP